MLKNILNLITNKFSYSKLTVIALLLTVQGCSTFGFNGDWPSDIPSKQYFIDECKKNTPYCENQADINTHLLWAKRFYKGSIIFPTGWHDMIDQVLITLESEQDKNAAEQQLRDMGDKIVIEWLKPNDVRAISSRHIAIWGTALRASSERNEQLDFIARVDQDVDALLSGELKPEIINSERYYPGEDYDEF